MGTAHVLFDVDDCPTLPLQADAGVIERLGSTVSGGIFGGPSWIMRTSAGGLQVMARLRRFRWDVQGFYRSAAVGRVLRAVGRRLAAIVGGRLDPATWRPKSMARAPGWRVREKSCTGVDRAIPWLIAER